MVGLTLGKFQSLAANHVAIYVHAASSFELSVRS